MAVNLSATAPDSLYPVTGVELGVAMAGIRKPGRKDLLVMRLAPGAVVAAVFTRNRFCAAPVLLARRHLAAGWGVRALVVNTGSANAGTGEDGIARAGAVCAGVARAMGCAVEQVLPFSTGVILETLPVEPIVDGIPLAMADLSASNWASAAEAIMTTDTVPKAASRRVRLSSGEVTVTGVAKGAGMIRPDMATMLGFVATDAVVTPAAVQSILQGAADESFNCITVDGDTSTNDAFVLIASGASGVQLANKEDMDALRGAVTDVAAQLAQAIVRDAEGATKFVTVRVEGGRTADECRRVAYSVAQSPLVKTAFFASDPNLGRILMAIGNSGIADLESGQIDLFLNEVHVVHSGARHAQYEDQLGSAVMRLAEFTVRVALGRGKAAATVWTCDLSYDYVKINAEYRT